MADIREFDLFADSQPRTGGALPAANLGPHRRVPARRRSGGVEFEPERAAKLLSEHEDYQVLRRLRLRDLSAPRPLAPGEQLSVIVDTETTGLDHAYDEIIEIGMVAFIHDRDGAITEVTGVFSALQEPSQSISPEIARLTGITAAMVEGQAIDIEAVERFIDAANLVIAHNAGFDRPFCERLARGFAPKP